MRRRVLVWSVLFAVLACSGGKESLVLTADPRTFAADGESIVELQAAVVFRGAPVADGKKVEFLCNEALLFSAREEATPEVSLGRQAGKSELSVTTAGGVARAFLLAPIDRVEIMDPYTVLTNRGLDQAEA